MELKKEVPIQGILLADSYETSFRPLTFECAKALIPLANVPMIEYSLEFLVESEILDVIVVCGWMSDQIEEYLKSSRWARYIGADEGLSISVQKFKSTTNAGDALRELDRADMIRSDPFVLVGGDVVSSVKLQPIIACHKARRKFSKNNLMTMVFSRVDTNRIQPLNEELVLVLNSKTKQILKYENNLESKRLLLSDSELFNDHPVIEIRNNLLDCYIDICSPEMLLQITDNYDYQDLRRDYVCNEVQNLDLGYCIHAYELTAPTEYAARVRDPRTYAAISTDIVRRWLYPLTPDANWWTEESNYKLERGFKYRELDVKVARSAVIEDNTMLGGYTTVGGSSRIDNSILGDRCTIGEHVVISGSYLWGDIIVEDFAEITNAIIGSGSVIRKGSIISGGSVIGHNAVVDSTTPPYVRISTSRLTGEDGGCGLDSDSDFGDFSDDGAVMESNSVDESVEADAEVVGVNGRGCRFVRPNESVPAWAVPACMDLLSADPKLCFDDLVQSVGCIELEEARSNVWNSTAADSDNEDDGHTDDDFRFLRDIKELTKGGSDNQANILLELNCFKYAENKTFEDVIFAISADVLVSVNRNLSTDEIVDDCKVCLEAWKPTLNKLCVDIDQEVALLLAVELFFVYGGEMCGRVGLAIHAGSFSSIVAPEKECTLAIRDAFVRVVNYLFVQGRFISADALIQWTVSHSAMHVSTTLIDFAVNVAYGIMPILLTGLQLENESKASIISQTKQRLTDCRSILEDFSQDEVTMGFVLMCLEAFLVYDMLYVPLDCSELVVANQAGLDAFPFVLLFLFAEFDVISMETIQQWRMLHEAYKIPTDVLQFPPLLKVVKIMVESVSSDEGSEEDSESDN